MVGALAALTGVGCALREIDEGETLTPEPKPEPAPPKPLPPSTMTRQQRRAVERQERKRLKPRCYQNGERKRP